MNQPEDDHQDIARMGYADMLHDDERNRAYDTAIRICVSTLVKERNSYGGDRFFRCLDIGTGSGLLSMMVVRAFRELDYKNFHVTALEQSEPMAECATRVISKNGMSESITVIPKSCQQLERPVEQFNLLVAELLDTELIGEGCLYAYADAVRYLCAYDCLFVPHSARVYIEPIASDFLFKRHAIDDLEFKLGPRKKIKVEVPPIVKSCCATYADELQVSMLKPGQDFIRVSEPKQIFTFRFSRIGEVEKETASVTFPIKERISQPPMVVMWWDLVMYDKDRTSTRYVQDVIDPEMPLDVLSCAPNWAKNATEIRKDQAILRLYGREAWREHWLQTIHYFGDIDQTKRLVGSHPLTLTIYGYHDTLSFWFHLNEYQAHYQVACSCGVHRQLSRNQLAFLSDEHNMVKLLKSAFYDVKTSTAKLLFTARRGFGDPGGFSKLEDPYSGISRGDLPKWQIRLDSTVNGLPSNLKLVDLSLNEDIPWKRVLRRLIYKLHIHPIDHFKIKCTQVRFDNLTRIRSDIGTCEGFNLGDLDKMLNFSSRYADKSTESYSLWEYGCKRLDEDHLITTSANIAASTIPMSGMFWERLTLPIRRNWNNWHSGWALVFWADFNLLNTNEVISTGPIRECKINERIEWNRHCKQIVYFMNDHPIPESGDQLSIDLDVGISLHGDFIVQRAIDYNQVPGGNLSAEELRMIAAAL